MSLREINTLLAVLAILLVALFLVPRLRAYQAYENVTKDIHTSSLLRITPDLLRTLTTDPTETLEEKIYHVGSLSFRTPWTPREQSLREDSEFYRFTNEVKMASVDLSQLPSIAEGFRATLDEKQLELVHDRYGEDVFANDFNAITFILERTPDELGVFATADMLHLHATLLSFKQFELDEQPDGGIQIFQTNALVGIQFGKPTSGRGTLINMFSKEGRSQASLFFEGATQKEIEAVIASMYETH